MAVSRAAFSAGVGAVPVRTVMTVWANRARRVSASGRARAGSGRSRGVEVDAGGAEVEVGAAERGAQPRVLVFGVDDPAFGPGVELPGDLQLGQVGLARAGRGQGDRVVVVLRPPVPGDQARPASTGPVQDAGQRVRRGRVPGQVPGVLAVHRQVQAQPEQLALRAGDLVGQRPGVLGGGLGGRVIQPPPPGPGAAGGFQPGALAPQPVRRDR
jgi:hypothetical protein